MIDKFTRREALAAIAGLAASPFLKRTSDAANRDPTQIAAKELETSPVDFENSEIYRKFKDSFFAEEEWQETLGKLATIPQEGDPSKTLRDRFEYVFESSFLEYAEMRNEDGTLKHYNGFEVLASEDFSDHVLDRMFSHIRDLGLFSETILMMKELSARARKKVKEYY